MCNYAMYADTAGICKAPEDEFFDLTHYKESDKKSLVEFRLRYSAKGYTEFCKQCNTYINGNTFLCRPAIQYREDAE